MATVTISGFAKADKQLAQLPLEMRGKAITAAIRKALKIHNKRAKELIPPPGYPGDKPEFTPLRETLITMIKQNEEGTLGIAGSRRGKGGGSHSHLVQESHRHFSHGRDTGVMTKATPYNEISAKDTKLRQRAAVIEGIKKASAKAIK